MILKALSVRQPWAWALLHGKPVENRKWAPSHRGLLLIHAALRFDNTGYQWIQDNFPHLGLDTDFPAKNKFFVGGIIGGVTLSDVVESYNSPFFFGPKGLVCKDPFELPFYPVPGKLGIFPVELPDSYMNCINSDMEPEMAIFN